MNNSSDLFLKPKISHKILNILLMILNTYSAIALYSTLNLSRGWHIGIDPETGAYSGPMLADFFLRKEFIIIPILLIVFMIVKEFKVKSFKKRIRMNLFILAGIIGHNIFILSVPFIFSLV